MTVFDAEYRKPLRYEILIKDSETFDTVERYTMFQPEKNVFGLVDLQFNNPYGQIPQAYFEFHDPLNEIDLDKFRKGNIVLVQGSKDKSVSIPPQWEHEESGNMYNMSYTKIERVHEIETIEGNNFYGFECVGTAKIIYDSVIEFIRNPQYKNLRKGFSNIDVKNEEYTIYKHLISLFTDKNVLPSGFGYTLQERGGFSLSEIDEKIKEVYPSIAKSYTKASDLINELADFAGCVWGVDEYNRVYFRHINDKTLGHVLKTYREPTDNDKYTGIILDDKVVKITSIDSNDGYFDVNFGFVKQANIYDVQGDIINYTSTYDFDIVQRCKAGTSRFRNLTLTLMRLGAGTDANDPTTAFMTGHICNDDNGKPGDQIVAKFWHPILQIPTTPTNISVSIVTNPEDIDVNAFYWLVLHKKGNKDTNCLRWYNNGVFDVNITDQWSGVRPVFERQKTQEVYAPTGYQLSNHGPTYSYAFASYSTIPNLSYNPFGFGSGIKRAPVEVVYNINWIRDVFTMQKFLNLMSFSGSVEPVTLQFDKVTIPNIPIRSGYTAQLITKHIAPRNRGGIVGTITNVGYKITGANTSDPSGPYGNTLCSVDFVAYFDQLDTKTDPIDSDEDY